MPRPALIWLLGGTARVPAIRENAAGATGLGRGCRLGLGVGRAAGGDGGLAGGGTGAATLGLGFGRGRGRAGLVAERVGVAAGLVAVG